jgi:hypothetical protein
MNTDFPLKYLRINSLSSAGFTISHQMLPVFWRSFCFSLYLFVDMEWREQCMKCGESWWPAETRAGSVNSFPDAGVVYLID